MSNRIISSAQIETARAASAQNKESARGPSALRFYGDEFVFESVSGMFFRVSPTASFVLRRLDAGTKVGDLPAALQVRYGIDRATATRDVELFVNELAALEPLDHLVHVE